MFRSLKDFIDSAINIVKEAATPFEPINQTDCVKWSKDRARKLACNIIKRFEGFSSIEYKCPAGVNSFGYGSLSSNYPEISFPVTKEKALQCLMKDVERFEEGIKEMTKPHLNDFEMAALISFCYNLGLGAYRGSTLRQKINNLDFKGAAKEFPRWNKAKVNGVYKTLPGLTRRRKAEKELFLRSFDK